MDITQFSELTYKDQLLIVNQNGKLKISFNVGEYEITLYKVYDFFVELKRHGNELYFDTIRALHYLDLPRAYQ